MAVTASAPAYAGTGFFFGFSDDGPEATGAVAAAPGRAVGATAFRVTLQWAPGESSLSAQDVTRLGTAVSGTSGLRLVLAVYGAASATPQTDASRTEFCSFARSAVAQFPSINDVVIWNEPNLGYFWQPQFGQDGSSLAPAAYEALLARCYDVLHAYRPAINVVGPATSPHGNDNPEATSEISHSPVNFIRLMGLAYRSSGRPQRLFDTVGQHIYQNTFNERPFRIHPAGGAITESDWSKLVATLHSAFDGTGQAVPGPACDVTCMPIWYLESGFQTDAPWPKSDLYFGIENMGGGIDDYAGGEPEFPNPSPLATSPAPDQATQLRYAVRLAYCQPNVAALFNFMVRDEANRQGWQSGVLWTDGTAKGSFDPLASVVADATARRVSCAAPTPPGRPSASVVGVPPIVTLDWTAAASAIGVSGYEVLRNGLPIARTTDLSYTDGTVVAGASYTYSVRGYDAAGGIGQAASAVIVSLGKLPSPPPPPVQAANRRCVVPNVRRKTVRRAKAALRSSSCRLGRVRYVRSSLKRGRVVGQSPRPRTRLRPGSRVGLQVSRGRRA
jgi:PASTA domain-containing protein